MTPQAWLRDLRNAIDVATARIFDEHAAAAGDYDPLVGEVHSALRDFAAHSAGLGAAFALAVVRGAGGDWRDAARAAAALDLLAAAVLIADDIIDRDDMRWGNPTIHARFTALAEEQRRRDPARFGTSVATIAADIAASLAYETLASLEAPAAVRCELFRLAAAGQRRVDWSQLIDLRFEDELVSAADWRRMAVNRAAAHIETSLQAGAAIAGLPREDVQSLVAAGSALGLLYDMRADLLDTFGRPTERRVVHRDLRMRKKPLYVCAASDAATPAARGELARMLAADEVPIEDVIRFVRPAGVAAVADLARDLTTAARDAFLATSLSAEAKTFFATMVERASNFGQLAESRRRA